jgi:hypothetical protein
MFSLEWLVYISNSRRPSRTPLSTLSTSKRYYNEISGFTTILPEINITKF